MASEPFLPSDSVLLFVIGIISVILNSAMIITLRRDTSRDASIILLMGLSCTDLVAAAMAILNVAAFQRMRRGQVGNSTNAAIIIFGITTSIAITFLLTLDRLLSVWKPLVRQNSSSPSIARKLVAMAILICACSVALLVLVEFYTKNVNICRIILSVFIFIAAIFLIVSHVYIGKRVNANRHRLTTDSGLPITGNDTPGSSVYSSYHDKQKELMVLCTAICVSFLVCSFPYFGYSLYCWNKVDFIESCITLNTAITFIVLNTVINPLIYVGTCAKRKCCARRTDEALVE